MTAENEIAFSKYMTGLRQEDFTQTSEFPPLPEPTGTPKRELFTFLTQSLLEQGTSTQDIEMLGEVYEFAHNAFEGSNKPIRQTGEETITHSLWMATLLAQNNITDTDVICATLLHDIPEDTDITLEEIKELTNERVAQLVDIVTKVKGSKLMENESIYTQQEQGRIDEEITKEKILSALELDPRAIIIKGADAAHNNIVPLPDDRKYVKAHLALSFYEPLVRKMGFTQIADLIGNSALKILKSDRYEEISKIQMQTLETELPLSYQNTINALIELAPDNMRILDVITDIKVPSIYEIYQRSGGLTPECTDCQPEITITCTDQTEALSWYQYLSFQHPFTENEIDSNPVHLLSKNKPIRKTVTIVHDGKETETQIVITTKEVEIKPSYLFITEGNSDATSKTTTEIAEGKLELLRESYRLSLKGQDGLGSISADFAESLGGELIRIFDKGGRSYTLRDGVTPLDLAHRIGRKLGNDTIGAVIILNGKRTPIPLDHPLSGGEQIELVAEKDNKPSPDRYDMVTTQKALTNTKYSLSVVEDDKEIISQAKLRGTEIVSWIYKTVRGKSLDIDIRYGMSERLEGEYQTAEKLLQHTGLTPVPSGKDAFVNKWLNSDELTIVQEDVLHLVDNLIDFRNECPIINILVPDNMGVLGKVGNALAESNVGVSPMRTRACNTLVEGETPYAEIELVVTEGAKNIDSAINTLQNTLGSAATILVSSESGENTQEE